MSLTAAHRSLAWTHLVPVDAGVELRGIPAEVRGPLESRQGIHAETLVSWDGSADALVGLEHYGAIVLMKPRGAPERALQATGFSTIRRFAVLPSLRRARWYLPVRSRKTAARAWDLYAPETWIGRAARAGARLLTRTLGGAILGESLIVAGRERSALETALAHATGRTDFDLAIGAPHAHGQRGRLWLLVIDSAGCALAYAKLAYLPESRDQLVREIEVTERVSALAFRTILVPRVLSSGPLGESHLMVSAPLSNASRVRAALDERHLAALAELAAQEGGCEAGELLETLNLRCRALASDLPPDWMSRLERAVEAVAATEDVRALPSSLAHGDFVPWNMRRLAGDARLAIFDWERGQERQFPLWDAFNFLTQVDIVLRRVPAEHSVREAIGQVSRSVLAQRLRLTLAQVRALYIAYLADASTRWFESHAAATWPVELTRTRTQPVHAALLDVALDGGRATRNGSATR